MPFSVQLGCFFALCCAFVALLGFLWKQKGAVGAPPVQWRRPVRSTVALLSNKWFTLGMIVAMAAWGFHVAALALAPISLVQAIIAGGLVLLTPMADRLFGFTVGRREWIGVGLTAVGLAFLAATLGDTGKEAHNDWDSWTLAIYCGVISIAAVGCCVLVLGDKRAPGPVLAVSAGLMWGASDVAIKAASGVLDDEGLAPALIHPLTIVIALLSLAGLVVSARSLQIGPAVGVIAITSAAANICTIASGPIVFGEPLPDDPLGLVVRIAAFVLVIGAAALTPTPESHLVEQDDEEPPAASTAGPAAPALQEA